MSLRTTVAQFSGEERAARMMTNAHALATRAPAVVRGATATRPHERKMAGWREPEVKQPAFRNGSSATNSLIGCEIGKRQRPHCEPGALPAELAAQRQDPYRNRRRRGRSNVAGDRFTSDGCDAAGQRVARDISMSHEYWLVGPDLNRRSPAPKAGLPNASGSS